MIVVRIELWKKGNPNDVELLGFMKIANDGSHPEHPKKGNYIAQMMRKPNFEVTNKAVGLEDWPRWEKTVWQMLLAILKKMYPN